MQFSKSLMIFLALATLPAHSQGFKNLTYVDSVVIASDRTQAGFAVQLPIKCSADRQIYVRFAAADSESSVTLIGGDGKLCPAFA